MPFAFQRELGEFPLLSSSLSNATLDFYTSVFDTNNVEPLEDARVNISKIGAPESEFAIIIRS